jgi:PhnB protein
MADRTIELMPYLQYPGNCEEAIHFYKDILQGRIEIISRYDNPAMKAPEEYKNKILHACFYFHNHLIFASDTLSKKSSGAMQTNVALSLGFRDEKEAKKIYDGHGAGGQIHVPFEKQFWGDWHGNFTDRLAIRWMINYVK